MSRLEKEKNVFPIYFGSFCSIGDLELQNQYQSENANLDRITQPLDGCNELCSYWTGHVQEEPESCHNGSGDSRVETCDQAIPENSDIGNQNSNTSNAEGIMGPLNILAAIRPMESSICNRTCITPCVMCDKTEGGSFKYESSSPSSFEVVLGSPRNEFSDNFDDDDYTLGSSSYCQSLTNNTPNTDRIMGPLNILAAIRPMESSICNRTCTTPCAVCDETVGGASEYESSSPSRFELVFSSSSSGSSDIFDQDDFTSDSDSDSYYQENLKKRKRATKRKKTVSKYNKGRKKKSKHKRRKH